MVVNGVSSVGGNQGAKQAPKAPASGGVVQLRSDSNILPKTSGTKTLQDQESSGNRIAEQSNSKDKKSTPEKPSNFSAKV